MLNVILNISLVRCTKSVWSWDENIGSPGFCTQNQSEDILGAPFPPIPFDNVLSLNICPHGHTCLTPLVNWVLLCNLPLFGRHYQKWIFGWDLFCYFLLFYFKHPPIDIVHKTPLGIFFCLGFCCGDPLFLMITKHGLPNNFQRMSSSLWWGICF